MFLLLEPVQVNLTWLDTHLKWQGNRTWRGILLKWQDNRKSCVEETPTCMEYLNREVVCLHKWYEGMHLIITPPIKVVECILDSIWEVILWKMEAILDTVLVEVEDEVEAVVATKDVVEAEEVVFVAKRDEVAMVVVEDMTTAEVMVEEVVVRHLNKT